MKNKAEEYTSPLIDELMKGVNQEDLEKTEFRMLLAIRIRDGIDKKGWNPADFAREMKKHKSEISKWLSGTHNFTAETLFEIGRKLGIELVRVCEPKPIQSISQVSIVVKAKSMKDMPITPYSGGERRSEWSSSEVDMFTVAYNKPIYA